MTHRDPIPLQPLRDGRVRPSRLFDALAGLDDIVTRAMAASTALEADMPALSEALALVATVDADGHVDITTHLQPADLIALLRVVCWTIEQTHPTAADGPSLFALADMPSRLQVDVSQTGHPFTWHLPLDTTGGAA